MQTSVSLQETIQTQQARIQQLDKRVKEQDTELKWTRELFSNPSMSATKKLILWRRTPPALKRGLTNVTITEEKPYIAQECKDVGMSADTYGSGLQDICKSTEVFSYRRQREYSEKLKKYVPRVYVTPTLALVEPQKIELPPSGKASAGHGGKRVKRCIACDSTNLVEVRHVVCADCGTSQDEKTVHLVNSPDAIVEQDATIPQDDVWSENATIPQDDVWSGEQVEDVSLCPSYGNLPDIGYVPITTTTLPDSPPEVQPENRPYRKMTDGDFSWEEFHLMRHGHGDINYRTRSNGDTNKYLPLKMKLEDEELKQDAEFQIEKYLAGDRNHLYASRLRFKDDNTTYVLAGDGDDAKETAIFRACMPLLAAAGIACVLWLRGTTGKHAGSSHLEIYFDSPVNAQAAHAHIIRVCPQLATVEEWFPVKDRASHPLSWPLFYADGNKVYECAVEIQLPGHPYFTSTGILSDKKRLTDLVAQAFTPAALIPSLPQERMKEPHSAVLLDRPLPLPTRPTKSVGQGDGLGKVVIAEFNESTSWDELIAKCGALARSGKFCAVWRGEKSPSCKVDADGKRACDYGKIGNYPKKFDKYEMWCLINGINKRDDLNKRIADYKARTERASA